MIKFLPHFTSIDGFSGSNGRSGHDVLEQDLVPKYPNSTHTSQVSVARYPDEVEPGWNRQRIPAPGDATGGNGG
jgi:hypothetical protein